MLKWHTWENTFLVADFDRTVTTWEPGWATWFWIFPRTPLPGISEMIRKEAKALFDYYYPIENDTSLPDDEKLLLMKEWTDKAIELLWNYLNSKHFEEVLTFAESEIQIRQWIQRFFQSLRDSGVPIIIFSAGVSNVIQRVLDVNWIPYDSIHSNELGFMREKLSLINNWVAIWDKSWNSLPEDTKLSVSNRTHKLVLWDSLDDLHMADSSRVSTSIWFLTTDKIKKGQTWDFKRRFDHVVVSDMCDEWFLAELYSHLG